MGPYIRTCRVHNGLHILDVSKAIRLSDDQFDFIVHDLYTYITEAIADRVYNMFFMSSYIPQQVRKGFDSTVASPPQPDLQFRFCFIIILQFI